MPNVTLSILIAARNEIYLDRTIRDVLSNAEGEIEVIVELDGYIPEPQIVLNDSRVTFIHHKESIGQRACINHAASIAKGEFIMKLDAHCAMDKGFDVKLAENCEPSWTVIPRMYCLDIETWKPKLNKRTDYMYISSPTAEDSFRAKYYNGVEFRAWHNRPNLIDDTMACMGPCWFMHKARFFEQGGCDEGHGSWGAMSVEVALKAWLSGGALKVNKNTWFAHWFRTGGTTGFPYPLSGNAVERARKYSQDLWLNDKWPLATRKLQWVIDKFKPPAWESKVEVISQEKKKELFVMYYRHIIKPGMNFIRWRGARVLKFPQDLALYQRATHDNKPDFIVETGTKEGGSALFFADICELNGKGHVISIDIGAKKQPSHPRITYINGSSKDRAIIEQVKKLVGDKSVMVVLDSDHHFHHVMWELHFFSKIVTKGQFMVIEDCYDRNGNPHQPMKARDWFLARYKGFKLSNYSDRYFVGLSMDGWLVKT